MARPVAKFNPKSYVITHVGNIQTMSERECQTLILECFDPWLEDLAEYLEDERPDLQAAIDRAMEVRGYDPP